MKKENRENKLTVERKKKSPLLQLYFTSLLSLMLCITMLFGTTMAWFTSEVTSANNEIHVGILSVDVEHEGVSLRDPNAAPVFGDDVYWEPGYTQIETLKIVNKGNLAFQWQMMLSKTENTTANLDAIGQHITVYAAKNVETLPDDFDALKESSEWTPIGNLNDVMTNSAVLADGVYPASETETITEGAEVATVSIALHMDENVGNEIMGEALKGIGIKLVASQVAYEEDGSGSEDTVQPETVAVSAENIGQIDFTQNDKIYELTGEFADNVVITSAAGLNIVFDGSKATFAEGKSLHINAPGDNDSYSVIAGKEKAGTYTVKNFTADSVVIQTYNTTVHISDNKVGAIAVRGGNLDLNVDGNTITGGADNAIWNDQKTEYGFYLNAVDYNLSFENNVISGTASHAVGINGRKVESTFPGSAENSDAVAANSISFAGNHVTVSTSGKAAIKIWDDTYFAPEKCDVETLNENAKNLVTAVLADATNELIVDDGEYKFNIYDAKFNELSTN